MEGEPLSDSEASAGYAVPEEGQKDPEAESWTSDWAGLQISGFYKSVGATGYLGPPKGLFLNKNPSH